MLKFTPREIQKQEFKKVIRGYDPVEVDTFLEMVADEFEYLLRQKKDFEEKVLKYEAELKNYRQVEETLQDTLVEAKRTSTETQETSRREAEMIIREAEFKAKEITEDARRKLVGLRDELKALKLQRESFVRRVKEWIRVLELDEDEIAEANAVERHRLPGSDSYRAPSRGAGEPDTGSGQRVLPEKPERAGTTSGDSIPEPPMREDERHGKEKFSAKKTEKSGEADTEPKTRKEEKPESRSSIHNGFNLIDEIIDEEDDSTTKPEGDDDD